MVDQEKTAANDTAENRVAADTETETAAVEPEPSAAEVLKRNIAQSRALLDAKKRKALGHDEADEQEGEAEAGHAGTGASPQRAGGGRGRGRQAGAAPLRGSQRSGRRGNR